MLRPTAFLLLAAVTLADLAHPQTVEWGQLLPNASPQGRYQHAMAYDSVRQRVVMYGGYNNAAGLSDTWEWNGATWIARQSLSPPAIRRWHRMAYDAARQRIVLYGGQSNSGSYPTDTWTWDGNTWTQHSVPGPGPRWRHAMAYDSVRQRVVLFGGGAPGTSNWTNHTWEWDGAAWTQQAPAASPTGRMDHVMAYDSVRQRTVMFGGWGGGSNYDVSTWTYDGNTWTQHATAVAPGPRIDTAMAFDPSRGTTVLFGGYDQSWGYLRDTWEWNGSTWIQGAPVMRPSARSSHVMAYDAARQAVILFGGSPGSNETWSTFLPAGASTYGAGCGAPALQFTPDPNGRPLLGQTALADIANAPSALVGVAGGWSKDHWGGAPLPMSLAPFGMTGCSLLQSLDLIGLPVVPTGGGNWRCQFAVPVHPYLFGRSFFVQAYALVPTATPVVSNGIEWRFGNV